MEQEPVVVRERRWVRRVIVAALLIALGVALWIFVFPWLDRTYVNKPAVESGMGRGSVLTRA